jgi:hypothetical protein
VGIIQTPGRIPQAEEVVAVELSCPATNEDDIFMALPKRLAECMLDNTQEFWWAEEIDHAVTYPKLAATVDELRIKLVNVRRLRLKKEW